MGNEAANSVTAGVQTGRAAQGAGQNEYHANVAAMDADIDAARTKYASELVAKHTTELPLPGGNPNATIKSVDTQGIAKDLSTVSDATAKDKLTKATLGWLDTSDQSSLKKTLGLPDSYNKSWGAAFMENTAVGRMIGKTGEGVQEGWGDRRMGIGPETEKWLRDKAVFNNPHSISIPQTINQVAIGGGSVILDGAARAFGSAYHGGANFLGQLANEVGVGGGKQLASDIKAAPEAFAGVSSLQVNASRVATAAKSGQLTQDARAVSAATKEAVKDAAKDAGKYKVEVSGVGSTGGNIRIVKKEAEAAAAEKTAAENKVFDGLEKVARAVRADHIGKPMGKGNVAAGELHLTDGTLVPKSATSRAAGEIKERPVPKSEGGAF